MLNDNGKIVGVIGSSLIEDDEVGSGGGDGDAGVTGNGDMSRKIDFLIGSANIGRVGDSVWDFVCWSILAKTYLMQNSCLNREYFYT